VRQGVAYDLLKDEVMKERYEVGKSLVPGVDIDIRRL